MDIQLNILSLLRNYWSLTESGLTINDVNFTTGWYDDNIAFPQITITHSSGPQSVLTAGIHPWYKIDDGVNINIWVRPQQDSGQSLGWAKNAEYKIRREIYKILRNNSELIDNNHSDFIFITKRRNLDEIKTRPIILRSLIEVRHNMFRED
jgi:hypothetical protein